MALADEAGQADGAAVAERDAPAATKDAEDGITGGHAQVTPKRQVQAACDRVALDSGDFCLMSRRVVEELRSLPESVRFPRGLRSWVGFPQIGVEYDRPARAAGATRYGLGQLYELATNGITAISIRPLKVAQLIGLLYLALSGVVFVLLFTNFASRGDEDQRFVMLMGIVLFSNAVVLFCLYIIGAYVGRAYIEAKRRPTYIVRDILGDPGEADRW